MTILHREALGHDAQTIQLYRQVLEGQPVREQIRILANLVSLAADSIDQDARRSTEVERAPAAARTPWWHLWRGTLRLSGCQRS